MPEDATVKGHDGGPSMRRVRSRRAATPPLYLVYTGTRATRCDGAPNAHAASPIVALPHQRIVLRT